MVRTKDPCVRRRFLRPSRRRAHLLRYLIQGKAQVGRVPDIEAHRKERVSESERCR